MTWRWIDSLGRLYDPSGDLAGSGYSGLGPGKNDPDDVGVEGVGPIPPGTWTLGAVVEGSKLGPYAIRLDPAPGTDTLGRAGFFIHGDSVAHPGSASHGCIILPLALRLRLWASADHQLVVQASGD